MKVRNILLALTMTLATSTTFADERATVTFGLSEKDDFIDKMGIIVTGEFALNQDAGIREGLNPYVSLFSITGDVRGLELTGTALSVGASIPTSLNVKPRLGVSFNTAEVDLGNVNGATVTVSNDVIGADFGLLVMTSSPLVFLVGYNPKFELANLSIGYSW